MHQTHWPLGTLLNVITVLAGSFTGIALQHAFTPDMQEIVFQAVGLGTILIAFKMMWKLPAGDMLLFIFALIAGGILGSYFNLAGWMEAMSGSIQSGMGNTDFAFTEGMITAFLLFCVGSMTIVGSLEEGLSGKRELLVIKSTLDGFSSIALAGTFGIGVAFSVIPLFIFQASLTILAKKGKRFFDDHTVDIISGVGGALIFGIAINLLQLGKINVENLMPALVIGVLFHKIRGKFHLYFPKRVKSEVQDETK